MNLASIVLHELVHFFLTLLVAIFFFRKYKDWRLVIAALAMGIFIDLDHWFDYFSCFGLRINLINFFNTGSYVQCTQKVYILLHGWEYLPVFGVIAGRLEKKLNLKGLVPVLIFAYLFHLFWDQFSFFHHPLAYSLIFRMVNNFSLKTFDGE